MSDIRTFYHCRNNGVAAIVTEKVYEQIQQWNKRRMQGVEYELYPRPIFAFYCGVSEAPPWMVGDEELMHRLTGDAIVRSAEFSVPFSNSEMYQDDPGRMKQVLERWMPSIAQIIEAFGLIVPSESVIDLDGDTQEAVSV